MTDKRNLNYVATRIIEILEAKMPNDTYYINEKIERLRDYGNNNALTLVWASNQLDDDSFRELLKLLDVSFYDVESFLRVMSKL